MVGMKREEVTVVNMSYSSTGQGHTQKKRASDRSMRAGCHPKTQRDKDRKEGVQYSECH